MLYSDKFANLLMVTMPTGESPMLTSIVLTLSVVALALVCCIGEWLPLDVVALSTTALLMVLGLVSPEEGISGFGNPATVTVMAMFILSAGISRTGAIQEVNNLLLRWGGKHPSRQIMTLGAIAGPITAFINNTAVVAVFLPIVEDWCTKEKISASKLLIPLSYITILGGTVTVVGTSTNILASGISKQLGYGEFSIFQFTRLGVVAFLVGLVYLAFVAPALLPNRKQIDVKTSSSSAADRYISEIVITPGSTLIGQTVASSCLKRSERCPHQRFDIDVLEIISGSARFFQPFGRRALKAGDILLVQASLGDLLQIKDEKGIEILPEIKFNRVSPAYENQTKDSDDEEGVTELLITSNSDLVGSSLKELRFQQRYNAIVLATRRGGADLARERLSDMPLRFGDVLLVQGPKQSLSGLHSSHDFLVLSQRDIDLARRDKAGIAVLIGLGVVVTAALDIFPIVVGSLLGAVLMVLTGCLKPGELYSAVRWNIIFLLAGLIPLGIAMENSGATQWLAGNLVNVSGALPDYGLLVFFFVLTSVLTEVLSNNTAVILLLPIAAEVASSLDLNPLSFILAVTFAASSSFLTPIGYQTNTMVYGPGGYKFLDFFKVGLPLNLLMIAIVPPAIVLFYGL